MIRSAGSKGLVDLVAWRERGSGSEYADVVFAQVKYTRSKGEAWADANWRTLERARTPDGVGVCAIVYRYGVTTPEVYWT